MSITPGPWQYVNGGFFAGRKHPVVTIGDDGGCGDPECCGRTTYHIDVTDDDAMLIAAAPDLLVALRVLVGIGRKNTSNPKYDDYFNAARAAIAKAEGK